MTETAIRIHARVLPGKRLDVYSSELREGANVEIIVLQSENAKTNADVPDTMGVWDWLQSLPPSNYTMEDWERIEREMKEEKDAWGD